MRELGDDRVGLLRFGISCTSVSLVARHHLGQEAASTMQHGYQPCMTLQRS